MEQKTPREIAEIVESTMRQFNSAMKRREALIIRIGAQTAQIIRISMIGLILLMIAMFTLLTILLTDMGDIIQRLDEVGSHMKQINQNIMLVAENMAGVRQSVDLVKTSINHLDEHVKVMPLMNVSVGKISDNMLKINDSINYININIASLNDHVDMMRVDMAQMSYQFGGLNSQLGVMGHNVDRMAAPMKMFPFPR